MTTLTYIKSIFLTLLLFISLSACQETRSTQLTKDKTTANSNGYLDLTEQVLTTWCDAMIDVQINSPANLTTHGALSCPACDKIHGRCMDAVYPFMYMADKTGEEKYLKAAIDVMDWSKNVTMPDGSWTVIPDPKSWKGISVFGAISLAEALKNHGHILSDEKHQEWTQRLDKVGIYIYNNFYMGFSHINYGMTSIYALHLLGEVLEKEEYIQKAAEMAKEIPKWITQNDSLIFGEDKPADKRSAKGLLPVDLAYNVEETLNGAVLYALETDNKELMDLLQKVLEAHLEFMLPDGGWDNSWGTRQNKWSYWGSRTTDGCQPAFAMMADKNPALGTAAYLNTELLEQCTIDGLLSGGLHYQTHGVKPCIHHTFAHAKSMAFILDHQDKLPIVSKDTPLPRAVNDGLHHFKDLDVWIANRGPWTATVSSYDNIFKTEGSNQATGGALSLLYHEKAGPLFAASMAKYKLAEKNNQQAQPGEEFATTPRLEIFENDRWYTNLYDLEASVKANDRDDRISFTISTELKDSDRKTFTPYNAYELHYSVSNDVVSIQVPAVEESVTLTLPLISPSTEVYKLDNPRNLHLQKESSLLQISSSLPLKIKAMDGSRIFNMVPGVEVIPVQIEIKKNQELNVIITIE